MPAIALSVVDVSCQRGGRLLFKGLSFDVQRGRLAWLRGRNGGGKTSLLRMAAGLMPVERGHIHCDRSEVVYIGHANAIKDDSSVIEALDFLLRLQGRRCERTELIDALDGMGLKERHAAPVRSLSQGQRRRVALARLAVAQPASMWLLDEPFDALDTDGCARLNALLRSQQQQGGSVLLSSHQPPQDAQVEVDLDRVAA